MFRGGLKRSVFLGLVAGLLMTGSAAFSEVSGQIPKEPVKWSVQAELPGGPLKPGDHFLVRLTAKIEEGWHLYSLEQAEGGPVPTRISVPAGQPFAQDGAIESSEPKSAMDPNFNLTTQYYEEEATFTVPVKVAANAPAGDPEVIISVGFQTCSDQLCLPPRTVKLGTAVTIVR
jgi:DsbC/DsbD-like thiol-disulfide interchange protein